MIITSRIASGFDVELQLAGGWFLTALRLLNDSGLLMPGSASIAGVQRSFAPGWDLHINVPGREQPVLARAELDAAGTHPNDFESLPEY